MLKRNQLEEGTKLKTQYLSSVKVSNKMEEGLRMIKESISPTNIKLHLVGSKNRLDSQVRSSSEVSLNRGSFDRERSRFEKERVCGCVYERVNEWECVYMRESREKETSQDKGEWGVKLVV